VAFTLPLTDRRWPDCRWPALDTIIRTMTGACRRGYGIAASLHGGGVFWACLVIDPTRPIDAAAHHVFATMQVGGGRVQHRTFMIPIDETDLALTDWLIELTTTVLPQLRAPELEIRAKELTAA